jgi:probable rRNA maturation factor
LTLKINFIYKEIKISPEINKTEFNKKVRTVIKNIAKEENRNFSFVNIVFCNDKIIKEYNNEFLKHDYETDIITFHDIDEENNIEGELLISLDTVDSNSIRYKTDFEQELKRVIIHGVLHLCGYRDKTDYEKSKMRRKENFYLNRLQ